MTEIKSAAVDTPFLFGWSSSTNLLNRNSSTVTRVRAISALAPMLLYQLPSPRDPGESKEVVDPGLEGTDEGGDSAFVT